MRSNLPRHSASVTRGSLAAYAEARSGFSLAYISALIQVQQTLAWVAWEAVKLIRTWEVLKLL